MYSIQNINYNLKGKNRKRTITPQPSENPKKGSVISMQPTTYYNTQSLLESSNYGKNKSKNNKIEKESLTPKDVYQRKVLNKSLSPVNTAINKSIRNKSKQNKRNYNTSPVVSKRFSSSNLLPVRTTSSLKPNKSTYVVSKLQSTSKNNYDNVRQFPVKAQTNETQTHQSDSNKRSTYYAKLKTIAKNFVNTNTLSHSNRNVLYATKKASNLKESNSMSKDLNNLNTSISSDYNQYKQDSHDLSTTAYSLQNSFIRVNNKSLVSANTASVDGINDAKSIKNYYIKSQSVTPELVQKDLTRQSSILNENQLYQTLDFDLIIRSEHMERKEYIRIEENIFKDHYENFKIKLNEIFLSEKAKEEENNINKFMKEIQLQINKYISILINQESQYRCLIASQEHLSRVKFSEEMAYLSTIVHFFQDEIKTRKVIESEKNIEYSLYKSIEKNIRPQSHLNVKPISNEYDQNIISPSISEVYSSNKESFHNVPSISVFNSITDNNTIDDAKLGISTNNKFVSIIDNIVNENDIQNINATKDTEAKSIYTETKGIDIKIKDIEDTCNDIKCNYLSPIDYSQDNNLHIDVNEQMEANASQASDDKLNHGKESVLIENDLFDKNHKNHSENTAQDSLNLVNELNSFYEFRVRQLHNKNNGKNQVQKSNYSDALFLLGNGIVYNNLQRAHYRTNIESSHEAKEICNEPWLYYQNLYG